MDVDSDKEAMKAAYGTDVAPEGLTTDPER
jgi:hypothetical protein